MSEHTSTPTASPSTGLAKFFNLKYALLAIIGLMLYFGRWDMPLIFKAAVPVDVLSQGREQGIINEQKDNELRPLEKAVEDNPSVANIKALNDKKMELRDRGIAIKNGYTPPPPPPGATQSAPQSSGQTSIVVHDVRYETANDRQLNVPASDPANGEYYFAVDAQFPKDIPIVPVEGEVWTFSFSDTLICAFNVPCVDAAGQGGKPSSVVGNDRAKYNVDDFPFQDVHCQEAAASTGDGIFGIGNTFAWTVTSRGASKPVSVAFNIRRSEIGAARGGGILKIQIIK